MLNYLQLLNSVTEMLSRIKQWHQIKPIWCLRGSREEGFKDTSTGIIFGVGAQLNKVISPIILFLFQLECVLTFKA